MAGSDDRLVVREDTALAAGGVVVLLEEYRLGFAEDFIEGPLGPLSGRVALADGVDDQVARSFNYLRWAEAVAADLDQPSHEFDGCLRPRPEQRVFRVAVHLRHIVKMPAASQVTVMLPPFGVTGSVEIPVSR